MKRGSIKGLVYRAAIALGAFMLMISCGQSGKVYKLAVGTYGEHIYICEFNHHTKEFVHKGMMTARNASYALPAKINGKEYIFAVSESGEESGVYSFESGKKVFEQTGYTQEPGTNPCFTMLYEGGKYMLTANYSGGSVSAFPVNGGTIGDLCASVKFNGQGVDSVRQASPHIHQLKTLHSAGRNWILATDLGTDAIRLISAETGKNGLELTHHTDIPCPAGSGPRHMELNADYTILYCITELTGEVLVYDVNHNADVPTFSLRQRIQADEANSRGSADIHIHPSGKWIYTSHRLKNDGIAIFNILPDGSLQKAGYIKTGRHPRNFMITDDGAYLMVACRDDKMIQVFEILPNGSLVLTSTTLHFEVDKPSSISNFRPF